MRAPILLLFCSFLLKLIHLFIDLICYFVCNIAMLKQCISIRLYLYWSCRPLHIACGISGVVIGATGPRAQSPSTTSPPLGGSKTTWNGKNGWTIWQINHFFPFSILKTTYIHFGSTNLKIFWGKLGKEVFISPLTRASITLATPLCGANSVWVSNEKYKSTSSYTGHFYT